MKWQMAWMVAGLGLAALLPAQAGEVGSGASARPVEHWIEDLGSDDYDKRVAAERALQGLGKTALPGREKAAETSDDSEVQWRARRLVRWIENGREGGTVEPRRPQQPRAADGDRARDRLGDMLQRLKADFDFDIDIDFDNGGTRVPELRDDPFTDFEPRMRELRQRLQDMHGRAQQSESRGMSMQVGPDGVRVEVEEQNEAGETESKVYEAPDMKTFRDQYADVLKEHGLDAGFDFQWHGQLPTDLPSFDFAEQWQQESGWPSGFVPLPADGQRRAAIGRITPRSAPQAAPPSDGERLGVFVRPEIPEVLRDYLELDSDLGLMVESVQEGSLAARLGLRRADIVTAIGDAKIGSPADVATALRAVAAGDEVEVSYLRKGVSKTATAKKAAPAEPDASERPESKVR